MRASRQQPPLYMGIDLGGTKVLALVSTTHGRILGESVAPTPADQGPQAVVETMVKAAREATLQAGAQPDALSAVGVAAAGAIDRVRGIVVHSPHLAGWDQVPLVEMLQRELKCQVVIANDASLAALGEHRYGAGRGVPNLLYLTVSTGGGGGMIIDNRLYQGAQGYAGEVGHITIKAGGPLCGCGNRGCLETLVSGSALAREARRRLEAGETSLLRELAGGRGAGAISAELVFEALRQGDAMARSIVEEGIHYLAAGLQSLVNIMDPDKLIIGGGLSQQWEAYIEPAVELMREWSFAGMAKELPVAPPELGAQAGALGAIALAAERGLGAHRSS